MKAAIIAGLVTFVVAAILPPVIIAHKRGDPPVVPSRMQNWTPNVPIDVWAGLSTPHVAGKPSPEDRKREEARICLALNAYHEARGEAFEGQVAVGQVALRRAGLDFRRVCAEIYKAGQFSWTAERPRGAALPRGEAWQWALAAAVASLAWAERGIGPDHSRGATFYHADHVKPYWTRGLELVAVIDNHRFYR